jgi:predicted acetyltransferase
MSAADAVLVRPSEGYRDGYIAAVREHQLEGRYLDARYVASDVERLERDFAGFVNEVLRLETLSSFATSVGRVPEAFYWLVDGDRFVGQISYRSFSPRDPGLREAGHVGYDVRPSMQRQGYGTRILGLMLEELRRRDLSAVYVNCNEDNEASRLVIERNGGTYVESISVPGQPALRRRYRIDVR